VVDDGEAVRRRTQYFEAPEPSGAVTPVQVTCTGVPEEAGTVTFAGAPRVPTLALALPVPFVVQ